MGRITAFILLLTGLATGVMGITAHQPPFLALAELIAAILMLLRGIQLLVSEEQEMRLARRSGRRS